MISGGVSGSDLAGGPGFGVADIGAITASIGTAFVGGAIFVDTTYCGIPPTPANLNPCPPRISTTPWVIDIITGVLVIQAVVVLYAISKWFEKPGGLSADPTTIAGVAAVMGHPEVERRFATLPADLTNAQLGDILKDDQYKLGTFTTAEGITKYGIMPVPLNERKPPKEPRKGLGWLTNLLSKLSSVLTVVRDKMTFVDSWKNARLYFDIFFGSVLLALLGLTVAAVVNVDQPQKIFLAAANANGVGMKIFFAILGIMVSFYWGRLFQDTQTFAPYYPLRHGEARPSPTILLNRHTSPLCAFLPLLRNRHLAAASVAFTGLTAEFLVIALAGLPYRPGQLRSEFLFCGIGASVILFFMIIQLVMVASWRRSLPHLPRRPDTIGAVMTYVAGTRMGRDFYGLEHMSTKERNEAIRKMGKVYAYGWRKEEDGRVRWVVDEVIEGERKSVISKSTRSHGGRPSGSSRGSGDLKGFEFYGNKV
ncbi:hypothetical protein B0H67DRAFT_638781 [Lasiosphaeris hirsuta]|uniref:Uncharacterized protein n=1 Tax=Lasiosphaeris hirsuta TaxID=260670 RepID=A0AA40B9R5_9PEZI|nr:hypothetical protein B0H67DRAFT_638781 [Lasiosphaeris hirsuta]